MSNQQPDPAAVRCAERVEDYLCDITPDDPELLKAITRECALREARALAEAVLSVPRFKALGKLARALQDALDGKAGKP